MLRTLCRIAPLALLLPIGGCFGSHGLDGSDPDSGTHRAPPPDGGSDTCDCCGTPVGIRAGESCFSGVCDPWCGVVEIDAGPGACPPHAIDVACSSASIAADRPQRLEVLVGGEDACLCGETITCTARVEAPGVLALDTGLCASPAFCEACQPFVEGSCALPPLGAGTWRVRVNGHDAMELD
nr:hypothetical protein [Myxococcota bacterium]